MYAIEFPTTITEEQVSQLVESFYEKYCVQPTASPGRGAAADAQVVGRRRR